MQKRQIIAHLLVPADQQPPEAIHPAMGPLHHPPTRPVPGFTRDRSGFLTLGLDVGGEPKLGQQLAHFVEVIALIQAHALWLLWGRRRARERDTGARLLDHLEVIPIGPLNGDPQGDAAAVGEHAPFGPELPAVGRILTHLFPPRGALVITPSMASHSQSMPCKASYSPRPCSQRARKTPPPSTPGSGDGRNCLNRGQCHSGRSIGTQYGGRRRWHPWPDDHRRGAGGTRTGAVSGAGALAGCAPTVRRGSATHAALALGHHAWIRLPGSRSFSP